MNNDPRDLYRIRQVTELTEAQIHALAQVLIDCVDGDASVSFMHPLSLSKALGFWRGVADGVHSGDRVLLVAEDASDIVGTVQLVFAQAENQPPTSPRCSCTVAPGAGGSGLR